MESKSEFCSEVLEKKKKNKKDEYRRFWPIYPFFAESPKKKTSNLSNASKPLTGYVIFPILED